MESRLTASGGSPLLGGELRYASQGSGIAMRMKDRRQEMGTKDGVFARCAVCCVSILL